MLHSEIAAVPTQRLETERQLLGGLPSLRPAIGRATTRKVDKLSCVRFSSARYSVPTALIGTQVQLLARSGRLTVLAPGTGEVVAEHPLVAPGEASVLDEHYGGPRRAPQRSARPRTAAEKTFCALGPVAQQWLVGAAAAGNTRLGPELTELAALEAAHGRQALTAALTRAVAFGRWHAADIRSILAAGTGVAEVRPPGEALVIPLPTTTTRSLAEYSMTNLGDTGATVTATAGGRS